MSPRPSPIERPPSPGLPAVRPAGAGTRSVCRSTGGLQSGPGLPLVFAVAAALGTMPAPGGTPALTAQETVPFRPGMVVDRSVRIAPGTYRIPAPASLDSALLVVRGSGVTVDMRGVRLEGLQPDADPDLATGVAVRIDGGEDVTLRGATIRGYRFAVLARGTRRLRLVGNDLSYNWKPRLFSLVGHESLVDWLSFHRNEDREWMRFGAAIYLEDVDGGEITGNRAIQGMNGLLAVRSTGLDIRDNELAFNSGLGIGLYRSSGNRIVRNRLDFNVRGYSHGFYNRGQDSAGILLYEQSSNNVIAYNSATHSGDGLFLWAGQSTMDTGEGGANDNLIFGNDFNWAPTNSVEVTFSRNRVVANRLQGSRYGVWGGYSWETVIEGNCFGGNETGIAIEHGQDNRIAHNWFRGDETAIEIWANPTEPEDWGYPRHRDTRSRGTEIRDNVLIGHGTVWKLRRTSGLEIGANRIFEEPADADAAEGVPARPGDCDPRLLLDDYEARTPDLPGVIPEVPEVALAGRDRSAMVVDEWGPFDWASPKLWPTDTARAEVRLRTLGPAGRWRVTGGRGVASLSAESGAIGDTLIVVPAEGSRRDWTVELEYVGEHTRSPRGLETETGVAVPFRFARFEPLGPWDVAFYRWRAPGADPAAEPAGAGDAPPVLPDPDADPAAFAALWDTEPLLRRTEARLDYQWYRPLVEALPPERWALEATTTVELPEGEHTLRTISDDGIRVWVDGELAIDHWEPHGSIVDLAPLPGGRHDIRVRYYQLGGWSEARVEIVRGTTASRGSAGPH